MQFQELKMELKNLHQRFQKINDRMDTLQTAIEDVKEETSKMIFNNPDRFGTFEQGFDIPIFTGASAYGNYIHINTFSNVLPIACSGTISGNLSLPSYQVIHGT